MESGIEWRDRNLVRESTKKGGFFLVVGESERVNLWQVLDPYLYPAPVGKTLEFGANFYQNYKTLYLMVLCKGFF